MKQDRARQKENNCIIIIKKCVRSQLLILLYLFSYLARIKWKVPFKIGGRVYQGITNSEQLIMNLSLIKLPTILPWILLIRLLTRKQTFKLRFREEFSKYVMISSIGFYFFSTEFVSLMFAAPLPRSPVVVTILAKDFFPFQKYEELPGKVIGILVSNPQWCLEQENRSGPLGSIVFARNGFSYRWVYVEGNKNSPIRNLALPIIKQKKQDNDAPPEMIDAKNGLRKQPQQKIELKTFPFLEIANEHNLKQLQIQRKFCLVEMEVNNGAGSPTVDALVATSIRVLDQSKAYPLNLDKLIPQLRQQYDRFLTDQNKSIEEAMSEAAEKAKPKTNSTASGFREQQTVMFVTWMEKSQELNVRFKTRLSDGFYTYTNNIRIELRRPRLKGNPLPIVQSQPIQRDFRQGCEFGVYFGHGYTIDRFGKVIGEENMAIDTFTHKLEGPKFKSQPIALPPLKKEKKEKKN